MNMFQNKKIWLQTCTAFGVDDKLEDTNKITEPKHDKRVKCYLNW